MHSTNRTTLELKQRNRSFFLSPHYSTNRTTLELKHLCSLCFTYILVLPIAPHWNWNTAFFSSASGIPTTNRTTLELKLIKKWEQTYFRLPTNRTTLELKRVKVSFDNQIGLSYQSHHTGIETQLWGKRGLRRFLPTNRTTLELKLQLWTILSVNSYYQSHHTGIETTENQECNQQLYSTNRTTLELKPVNPLPCNAVLAATNRTTLELKQK